MTIDETPSGRAVFWVLEGLSLGCLGLALYVLKLHYHNGRLKNKSLLFFHLFSITVLTVMVMYFLDVVTMWECPMFQTLRFYINIVNPCIGLTFCHNRYSLLSYKV